MTAYDPTPNVYDYPQRFTPPPCDSEFGEACYWHDLPKEDDDLRAARIIFGAILAGIALIAYGVWTVFR